MILQFPHLDRAVDKSSERRARWPAGEWTVLSTQKTFLVPLGLPARLLRKMTRAQIETMAFDRIPLKLEDARVWVLLPNLGFFSSGVVTAWVVAAPLSAMPAAFDRVIPEDILLASFVSNRRFSRGALIVFDSPKICVWVSAGSGGKTIQISKQMLDSSSTASSLEPPPSMTAVLGTRASLVRLDGGGPAESSLKKFGEVRTEDAAQALSDQIPELRSGKRGTVLPYLIGEPGDESAGKFESVAAGAPTLFGRWARAALVLTALCLPVLTLGVWKHRYDRISNSLAAKMSDAYKQRFGAAVPDPVFALRAKSETRGAAAKSSAAPLWALLSAIDRISGQAASASLRLDAISLDGIRLEIRGTSSDVQSVAQWVAGLSAHPSLTEAALVSSEVRLSDKQTVFLVRAKLRLSRENPPS